MTSAPAQELRRPRENLGVSSRLAEISQSRLTCPLAGLCTGALTETAQAHIAFCVYLKDASLHHPSSPKPQPFRVPSTFTGSQNGKEAQ